MDCRRIPIFFLSLLFAIKMSASNGFSVKQVARGGGRSPSQPDQITSSDGVDVSQEEASTRWCAAPCDPSECRLIICHITDVYTLEHLASFKSLIEETRRNAKGAKVTSICTGDFLSPYLLSSVDRGAGMMNALNKIPLDYLTWGNHEADIEHRTVCKHVRNFQGTWINSNMIDHEAMDSQVEYDVIQLTSPDGTNTRKVGLCAVLSDDADLYSHFKSPGAFGGATVTDPWKALTKYQKILQEEQGCDLVVPLQHLYVPDDHRTCREFDFPVVLSGHDHHRVDEVVAGTRLLKPGMNAIYAGVYEISWKTNDADAAPKIRARFVQCSDWEADPDLAEENERAYDALIPLRNTELARVPETFEPLSSGNARGSVCTMGKYLCSLLRSAMNVRRRQRMHSVDAVLIMGGNVRGNVPEYPKGSFFSLEMLEAETKSDEVLGVVPMPGWLLAEGVEATHGGEPIPGWVQYDQGVRQVELVPNEVGPPRVTHVAGEPLDPNRIYRVATKISDLTNGQSPPWTLYYSSNPKVLPPKGAYVNVQSELMSYFARNVWRKLWDATSECLSGTKSFGDDELCGVTDELEGTCHPEARLNVLDKDGDGIVSVNDIQDALRDMLGYSVDERNQSLAQFVHSFADTTGDGTIRSEDLEKFCEELEDLYKNDDWRLSHRKTFIPILSVEDKVDKEAFDRARNAIDDPSSYVS